MKNNKTNEKVKPKPKKTGVKLLSDEKYFSNDKIKSDEVRIIETYLKSDGKPLKIFAGLFKGHYSKLILHNKERSFLGSACYYCQSY